MISRYDDLSRPPLDSTALRRALVEGDSRWIEVTVVDALPSTNAALAEQARSGGQDGTVLIAEHQTAGRGRLDRTWVAAPRAGITMSVLVRPRDIPVARWSWLPLLSGLAVAAAVQQVAEVPAVLKWPNDVTIADRKLAGLLVERIEGSPAAAVIGIGLNVTNTPEELPIPEATSLRLESARSTDRMTLVKAMLRRLDGLLTEWENASGVPSDGLRTSYRSACASIGRLVRVELPGQAGVEGVVRDVDDDGRLVVETPSGRSVFGAGDVLHVRRQT